MLPAILDHLRQAAPRSEIRCNSLHWADLKAELGAGRIDLAIEIARPTDAALRRQHLLDDSLCVMAGRSRWRGRCVRRVQAVAAYLDARRGLAQVVEDRREHQRLQLLRHVQLEGPRVAPRVECLAAIHAAVQAGEGVMDARRQSLGQRRRRDPASLADEQRVAELVA
ncbi:LysR substrate-binding domain-containing protein, partial [Pseudomonas aeruginosa]